MLSFGVGLSRESRMKRRSRVNSACSSLPNKPHEHESNGPDSLCDGGGPLGLVGRLVHLCSQIGDVALESLAGGVLLLGGHINEGQN